MSVAFYDDEVRSPSNSKRWSTTTGSALEDVIKANQSLEDRGTILTKLKSAKLASTKGSISFGHEAVKYVSCNHEAESNALIGQSEGNRLEQKQRIKDMKKNLTTTNFSLGTEPVLYESLEHESFRESAQSISAGCRPESCKELKEAIKRSSLHFGNEKVLYQSVNAEGFKKLELEGATNIKTRKLEQKAMKDRLTRHNFTLGEEKVDYTSDYTSGFGSLPADAYHVDKASLKKQIEDIRKCHFTLGNDKVKYETDMQRSTAYRADPIKAAKDAADSLENARLMKAALQRTNIVIGDDEEYF